MSRIIAIANQKGGVGKTTTTLNLGAALVQRSRRVLLIDVDPQECLSTALKIPTPEAGNSITEALAETVTLESILCEAHGMSVAPAGADLAEAEARLYTDPTGVAALREALKPVAKRFDYTLIDCPPSLGPLVVNALLAAHEVLIPCQSEFLALRRLGAILRTIERAKRLNPQLRVLGVLPTLYDGRTLHAREVLEQITKTLGNDVRVFTPIPRSIRFAEQAVAGHPIFAYAGDIEGARAYTALAEEVDQ